MINWMDYGKIQEHKRNGLKKSQVAKRLADEYKDYVVECLKKYQDMSAAQIYDWIKEQTCLESLYFQKRAFRNYVQEIRKEYRIKKPVSAKDYEAVDELPPGQQAQVNMGKIKIKTITGIHRKIY